MKRVILSLTIVMMFAGVLAGCGNSGSATQKDVPVEDILQAVKDAYGENYLPDTAVDEVTLEEMLGIDTEDMETVVAEMPMIGFHPDRVIIAKAKEGKGAEVEEEFLDFKEYLVEESFMYPANMAKTKAAEVVRNGDYVAFLLVGAANENMDASEEEQLKFAQEQTKIAVDAFNSVFE